MWRTISAMSYRHPSATKAHAPRRATRDRLLHRKRGNIQLTRYRSGQRQYPEGMPHVRDSNSEPAARENFAAWLQGVLSIQRAKGRSKSAVADLTGINRNTIDRWLKKEVFPTPENVRRFCDALGLDYSEPSRLLGWNSDTEFTPPSDLGGFIRRAKMLAEHPKTSERRRRQLEQQIAAAESVRRAAATQRVTADQMERSAEALLKEALEDPEDVNDH